MPTRAPTTSPFAAALRPPAGHEPAGPVRLAEVLAPLSHALDLTEGQPAGHALRSCLIGMRLASELGLGDADRSALYYALLFKDAGGSSNAARLSALFGADDQAVKAQMTLVDWHDPVALATESWDCTGREGAGRRARLVERVRQFAAIAASPGVMRDLIQVRCDRGAAFSLGLGLPAATADAIRSLDEHWSGRGYPDGKRGAEIPLLARIANIAQCVEAFYASNGLDDALRIVRRRRGRWFDPALVDRLVEWRRDRAWWEALRGQDAAAAVLAAEPAEHVVYVDDAGIDEVARTFAEIMDAKSSFTRGHSTTVADLACGAGRAMRLDAKALSRLRRAALLHDVGKLSVSSRILDKAGTLTDEDRREVEQHPLHTFEILSNVRAFEPFAWTAAAHHEKLDGSGYPWGVTAERLDGPARILGAAEMYEGLTASRPWRAGLGRAQALAILSRERWEGRLCGEAIAALAEYVNSAAPERGEGASGQS